MAGFWPTADSDPSSTGPVADFARIWRDITKGVPDEVSALKAQPGGDLALGGAELVKAFRQHDLVDEYRLYVHPVLIGRGKPPVPDVGHQTGAPARRDQAIRQRGRAPPVLTLTKRYER